jgi:hypothetical protein
MVVLTSLTLPFVFGDAQPLGGLIFASDTLVNYGSGRTAEAARRARGRGHGRRAPRRIHGHVHSGRMLWHTCGDWHPPGSAD